MMKIYLSPRRMDDKLKTVSISDKSIVINGVNFDFSCMSNGDVVPAEAISSEFINHDVEMVDDCIVATITIPHGANASRKTLFPSAFTDPLIVTSGPVPLPPFDDGEVE